jgi:hypothetical protein
MSDSGQRNRAGAADRALAVFLFLVGLWVVFAPGFLGWNDLRERGLESAVLRLLVGSLFVFVSGTLIERRRTQRALGDVHEALNMLVYGRNYRRDREAVEILLRALRSKDAEVREKAWKSLRDLTGCDFALDAEVWESWWKANERRFALKSKRPDARE